MNSVSASMKRRRLIGRIATYVLMAVLGFAFVLPFLWAISTSLKMPQHIYVFPPQWVPSPAVFENYPQALRLAPFARYFLNTVIITVVSGVGRVFISALIGYGFARFEFPGKTPLFLILLGTMMIPAEVLMVPRFLMFNQIGWTNSFLPLIVPAYLGQAPFVIFLARQFFLSLPRQLDEAAEIDGCGPMRIFSHIILPLSKPFLATAAILSFQWDWNDFLGPLVFLQSETMYTVSLGLRYLQSMSGGADMGGLPMDHLIMAASLTVLAPVILIFLAAQKYFVQGIVLSGIKG